MIGPVNVQSDRLFPISPTSLWAQIPPSARPAIQAQVLRKRLKLSRSFCAGRGLRDGAENTQAPGPA